MKDRHVPECFVCLPYVPYLYVFYSFEQYLIDFKDSRNISRILLETTFFATENSQNLELVEDRSQYSL